MITQRDIRKILEKYDSRSITVGTLGGHSALDICRGAKNQGFKTLVVCQRGREKTYSRYFKSRGFEGNVDDVIVLERFKDSIRKGVQEELRRRNTVFIHSRYFWVYCDFNDIERKFLIPIFGTRSIIKLEERNVSNNQYFLLKKAGIRIPKIFKKPTEIDRHVIVKAGEAIRGYERAFFIADSPKSFETKSKELLARNIIKPESLKRAIIEEYVVGAQVNFNYFYSPIKKRLELLGTDIRRQTNLDGLLRMPASDQLEAMKSIMPSFIETGHVAVTVKESLIEKAFEMGERFVRATQKICPPGIIGPFALQGAVTSEKGREDIVIFDASLRIPGSPGTMFTPYSAYLYGRSVSLGERIAMEIKTAILEKKLPLVCT